MNRWMDKHEPFARRQLRKPHFTLWYGSFFWQGAKDRIKYPMVTAGARNLEERSEGPTRALITKGPWIEEKRQQGKWTEKMPPQEGDKIALLTSSSTMWTNVLWVKQNQQFTYNAQVLQPQNWKGRQSHKYSSLLPQRLCTLHQLVKLWPHGIVRWIWLQDLRSATRASATVGKLWGLCEAQSLKLESLYQSHRFVRLVCF